MSQSPSYVTSNGPPAPTRPDVLTAWPRTAQWAMAFLLVLAILLIAIRSIGLSRWATRPTELERRLDLNRADRAELALLPNIGEGLAGRIDEYRRKNRGFRSVEELKNVSGIGEVRLETLRQLVYVDELSIPGEEGIYRPVSVKPSALPASAIPPGSRSKKGEGVIDPIDINRASEEQLRQLPGIGPTLARRIIEARQVAPFRSVDELRRVRGIGAKTLEKLRPHVTIEAPGGASARAA